MVHCPTQCINDGTSTQHHARKPKEAHAWPVAMSGSRLLTEGTAHHCTRSFKAHGRLGFCGVVCAQLGQQA